MPAWLYRRRVNIGKSRLTNYNYRQLLIIKNLKVAHLKWALVANYSVVVVTMNVIIRLAISLDNTTKMQKTNLMDGLDSVRLIEMFKAQK